MRRDLADHYFSLAHELDQHPSSDPDRCINRSAYHGSACNYNARSGRGVPPECLLTSWLAHGRIGTDNGAFLGPEQVCLWFSQSRMGRCNRCNGPLAESRLNSSIAALAPSTPSIDVIQESAGHKRPESAYAGAAHRVDKGSGRQRKTRRSNREGSVAADTRLMAKSRKLKARAGSPSACDSGTRECRCKRNRLCLAPGEITKTHVAWANASSNMTEYGLQVGPMCAHSGMPQYEGYNHPGWPAGSAMPPCWIGKSCISALDAALSGWQDKSKSCSVALEKAGCYNLLRDPDVVGTRYRIARHFLQQGCGRLVPRDGCMCLPCYTECRRSALCPVDPLSGEPPPDVPPPPATGRFAYVITLTFSWDFIREHGMRHWVEKYIPGVLRVALSLRDVGSKYPLVVVGSNLTRGHLRVLRRANISVVHTNPIPGPLRHRRARFTATFTKFALWNLTQYDKVISLDCDVIVHRNIDHLFSDAIVAPAAVSEGRTPRTWGSSRIIAFNSGVMVIAPSRREFESILGSMEALNTYDGGEQGLLTSYLVSPRSRSTWHELPRKYGLFHCTQADEVDAAYVWHVNAGFMAGGKHPLFLSVDHELMRRARHASLCNNRCLAKLREEPFQQ